MSFGSGRAQRQPKPRRSAKSQAEAEPLNQKKLEELALSYLNRFDCTAQKLARHLGERVRKLGGHPEAARWIAELVQRFQGSGVLNDARFAEHLAAQLARRGKSARAISQKLSARGVAGELTSELLAQRKQAEPEAELEAARAYARKRRLGPHRAAEERLSHRQKDLASLARQGFSFEIASRALASESTEDEL